MDELEAAALHFGDYAHVANAAAAGATVEKHQVARAQFIAAHATAIVDLSARRAVEVVAESLEHVACEARAVKAAGARRAAAVGHALELECVVEDGLYVVASAVVNACVRNLLLHAFAHSMVAELGVPGDKAEGKCNQEKYFGKMLVL
mgnify:CR=1 FL=1